MCPACGVAVVPGYVKCPKCHRSLPRFARNSISPVGGTVITEKTNMWWPVLGVVLGIAVVTFIGWQVRSAFADYRNKSHHVRDAGVVTEEPTNQPVQPTINDSIAAGQPNIPAPTAPKLRASDVAKDLERGLNKQRLWSTVTVIGDRVEVRSASCADTGMKPTIETAVTSFHAAGLTKLRCLEQSGGVVFTRDL